jgi:hypothetical protein
MITFSCAASVCDVFKKTLTKNSFRQLKFSDKTYDLKYPLILKIFYSTENLNKYFDLFPEKKYLENFVITKLSNKFSKK